MCGLSPGDAKSIDPPSCGTWSVKGRLGGLAFSSKGPAGRQEEILSPREASDGRPPPPHSPSKHLKIQGLAFFCIFLPQMDDPSAPATVSMKSPGGPGACISTSDREDQKAPACRQGESAQTTESPTAEELGSDGCPQAGPIG